jgi:hypothetical protein
MLYNAVNAPGKEAITIMQMVPNAGRTPNDAPCF